MSLINVLDKSVSELIAAGEVIERPASVVKELVENSIDAGATKIKIEIKNGGITYIKITDNGSGIYKDDVKKAFLRHATSKVGKISDLDNILTLGFRGEALASICAVSKIELITRTKDEMDGTRYVVSGNGEGVIEEIGAPVGTTIIVRDLFFNVPARIKFLKRDVTEGNAVAAIIERLALSHPEISFNFIREGNEKLLTFGDGSLLSTIYCVFGKQLASTMLPLKYEDNNIVISGYISNPSETRGSRTMQTFFVNSRYVKSKTCCAALEEAYKSFIVQGRYPACILNINISSGVIDINVHPAKLETRFANEKMIYDIVYSGVKNCILSHAQSPVMTLKTDSSEFLNKKNEISDIKEENKNLFSKKLNSLIDGYNKPVNHIDEKNNNFFSSKKPALKIDNNISKTNVNKNFVDVSDFKVVLKEVNKSYEKIKDIKTEKDIKSEKIENKVNKLENINISSNYEQKKIDYGEDDNKNETIKENNKLNKELEEIKEEKNISEEDISENKIKKENEQQSFLKDEEKNKFIGEIFNSYIILEKRDEIIFIDKHAAHERIIYEKIKDGRFKQYRQILLRPEPINLSLTEYQASIDNLTIFENMGFLIEDFGNKTIIVREVPMILEKEKITDIIEEIIDNIVNNKNNIVPHILDKIYFTFACKAAIKAGDKNEEIELREIVNILEKNKDLKNCPHGRPISFIIKRKNIEKQFLR